MPPPIEPVMAIQRFYGQKCGQITLQVTLSTCYFRNKMVDELFSTFLLKLNHNLKNLKYFYKNIEYRLTLLHCGVVRQARRCGLGWLQDIGLPAILMGHGLRPAMSWLQTAVSHPSLWCIARGHARPQKVRSKKIPAFSREFSFGMGPNHDRGWRGPSPHPPVQAAGHPLDH